MLRLIVGNAEGMQMGDFELGDTVEVKFRGVVVNQKSQAPGLNTWEISYGSFRSIVSEGALTKLRPKLAVGQKYKFFHGEILEIVEVGKLVLAAKYADGKITALKISDIDDRFKLISEVEP